MSLIVCLSCGFRQKKNADAQIQRKNDIVAKLHQKAESVLKFEGSCEEARSLLAKAVAIEETGRNDNVYLADLWYLIGVSYRREKEFVLNTGCQPSI